MPNELYDDDELRSGIPVNADWLETWAQEVNSYDFDAYLTEETAQWFKARMQEFSHPKALVIEEFITLEGDIIPGWFEALVILARAHTRNRNHPALALAPRPKGGYNAEILRLVGVGLGVQEMQEV